MFCVGDKVVHPKHGAGVICDVVSEKVDRVVQEYYVFKMSIGGLVLKIPVASSHLVGLRAVVDADAAAALLRAIPELEVEAVANWNQRYRENMEKLKSGDLYEVARVIKGLAMREKRRGLSNGELKMLHTAKQILLSELVLAMGQEYQGVERQLSAAITGERAG